MSNERKAPLWMIALFWVVVVTAVVSTSYTSWVLYNNIQVSEKLYEARKEALRNDPFCTEPCQETLK